MVRTHQRIPNRLWRYRTLAGYTQKEVAVLLGVADTAMISRWERGLTMPSGEHLLKLSKLYKTLVNELYYELGKEYEQELARVIKKQQSNGP